MTPDNVATMPRKPSAETLGAFVRQQDAATLAAVLLELADAHGAVRDRLVRLQRSNQPKALAAELRKTLTAWRRPGKRLSAFCKDRSGEHPRRVLAAFGATLVTDDSAGYHALHRRGVRSALCWAHARRKLFEAHRDTGSEIAGQAVTLIAKLYEIEREAREVAPDARQQIRQQRSKPIVDALRTWLVAKRQALAKANVTAKAIDYSLSNWTVLSHFLDDGNVPIDNDAAENSVRPLAVGRRTGSSWVRSKRANAPASC